MPAEFTANWSALLRPMAAATGLALFWFLETRTPATLRPRASPVSSRLIHAARNYGLAILNGLVILPLAGILVVATCELSHKNPWALLHLQPFPEWMRFGCALLLLDFWTWMWHLTCHRLPLLWRFHRVHHSDTAMDVSSSARFHPGELACSTVARIPMILALGIRTEDLLIYETLLLAISQFHHSAINAEQTDRWLGWLLVTPGIHRIHHSRNRSETNSNFAAVLSVWDRLCRTSRPANSNPAEAPGLHELQAERYQTLPGLLKTPFVSLPGSLRHPASDPQTSVPHQPSPENQTGPASEPSRE